MNIAPRSGPVKTAVLLTFIMAVGWAVCFWPARYMKGHAGVSWMTLAAICCLIPGWIVVFVSRLAIFRHDLAAMLVQTLLRLGLVGAVALVVVFQYPRVGIADFYGWLVGFYLLALATETVLSQPKRRKTE